MSRPPLSLPCGTTCAPRAPVAELEAGRFLFTRFVIVFLMVAQREMSWYTPRSRKVAAKAVQAYLQVQMLLKNTTLSRTGIVMMVDFGDPTLIWYLLGIRAMVDMQHSPQMIELAVKTEKTGVRLRTAG